MGSKAILFLCLFALVMMIASEVSARDLAETETETKGVEESKYGGGGGGYPGGGYPGRGGGGYPGGGYPGGGGGYPGGGYPGRGGGGGGGGCRYGRCCGRYGCRCCNYAGEVVNAETETEPQN